MEQEISAEKMASAENQARVAWLLAILAVGVPLFGLIAFPVGMSAHTRSNGKHGLQGAVAGIIMAGFGVFIWVAVLMDLN